MAAWTISESRPSANIMILNSGVVIAMHLVSGRLRQIADAWFVSPLSNLGKLSIDDRF